MLYTADQVAQLPVNGFRYLITSLEDHVMTITLNRPEKKNALHPPMLHELAFALAYAHHTPEVWIVVLAASGDTFCAGMDLKALSVGDTEQATVPAPSGPVRLGELMAQLCKPCIARVQGPVYAGGFLLVGASTYVVAVESATFSLPEVKRGLFPFQVMAVLLDIMPARTALDLCLRARTLSAAEALAFGLVTTLATAAELGATVTGLLDELKQLSPTAMQFGLRAYQQLKSLPSSEQQAYLYEQFGQLQQTPDAKEGMAAFLEKRKPNWNP
ncbi:enoyl-CoA hydratase/isomerase family protein [Spirosoma oryzicola]|uniref:enoyl-CoA hydratase/isomerase family protein n=1 Tax=Spirosoma oryzicola TaxID=2898794 RepID=UPI001E58E947|nr:enoyl-CoA hydratase-related protein [Spirosoma oryzicola]UHG90859.1 enoyl-CoA hydratase-related protein [Spirosoma oryzicola]